MVYLQLNQTLKYFQGHFIRMKKTIHKFCYSFKEYFFYALIVLCVSFTPTKHAFAQTGGGFNVQQLSPTQLIEAVRDSTIPVADVISNYAQTPGISLSQATTTITNLVQSGVNSNQAGQLMELAQNSLIPSDLAAQLSAIPDFGNITGSAALQSVLSSASVTSFLNSSSISGGVAGFNEALTSVTSVLGGVEAVTQLASQAGTFANTLTTANANLTSIVSGGLGEIQSQITSMGTGFISQLTNTQLVESVTAGLLPLTSVAAQLAENISAPISDAMEMLNNFDIGGVSIAQAGQLLNQVGAGQIPAALGTVLSSVPNLGNLPGISQLQSVLSSVNVVAQLEDIVTNLGQAAAQQAIAAITNAVGGIQGMVNGATAAGAAALANSLNAVAPGLVEALGGVANLANGIGGALGSALGGGLGGALGGALGIGGLGGAHDCCQCKAPIITNHQRIREHVSNEFKSHREWFVNDYFLQNILPAMQLMAMQLTSTAMAQVQAIGMFFDAKHQLETQRIFQVLTAKAHAAYLPNVGVCAYGTGLRSLAASQRKADLAHSVVATRMMDRQLLSGDNLADGQGSDKKSRIRDFIAKYCNPKDNGNGLARFCTGSAATADRYNKDVNYTLTVENKLTLETDFSATDPNNPSADEEDIFALSANLFAHDTLPFMGARMLADGNEETKAAAATYIIELRSLAAKRSVAQNSFAALVGMRSAGDASAAPYLKSLLRDMGVSDTDIEEIAGENPSELATIEILTKYALQDPAFYENLQTSPENVERMGAILQAVGLMQDRMIFEGLQREEAILATYLETKLLDEHRRVSGRLSSVSTLSPAFDPGGTVGAGPQ